MRKILSMGLLLAAAGTFLAAQHDHAGPAKTYVGELAKAPGGAMIGVVLEGEEFQAYLCSNDDAFNASHARWFRGTVGKQGTLEAEGGGAKLVGKLADGKFEGAVTGSDNQAFAFTATACKSGGVFRAEAIIEKDHYVAGWVRNDDGATVGAAATKGKQTALKQQPSPKAKAPPVGLVGQGENSKKLTGKQVDDLGLPLPGQILQATLTGIDAKKKQVTVKTIDGKSLTLPADNFFSTDSKGKRSAENLGTPTPFLKIGGFFHITRECVETTTVNKKTGTTTKSKKCSIDMGFGGTT